MFPRLDDPKKMGQYFALSQVGLEMVVPIIGGLAADHYFGWTPWGVVAGTILGFGGGLLHLLNLLKQQEESNQPSKPAQDKKP